VIDRVVAVGGRLDADGDAEFFRHGFDARLIGGGQADEMRIEIRHVFRQLRRRIAFCVHRNEDHLRYDHRAIGAQTLLNGRQGGQGGGAKIRTICITEKHQRPMAVEISGAKLPPLCIDQAKIREFTGGREHGTRG